MSRLAGVTATVWQPQNARYPPARRSDHVDIYKSEAREEVRVQDPYQWLEDNSPETDAWTTSQVDFTRAYLDKNPDRKRLENLFRASMDYAKASAPFRSVKSGPWYWWYNSGLQAQSALYRSSDENLPDVPSDGGPGGELFFDPNLLSKDGTVSIATYSFSKCSKYMAYALSYGGGDETIVYVRRTNSPFVEINGQRPSHDEGRFPEELRHVKFSSLVWTHDSMGFFYQRMPDRSSTIENGTTIETQKDINAMLYYHRVNTSQSDDILVHSDPENPTWMWGAQVTQVDGRYLVLYTHKDTTPNTKLWFADLEQSPIGQNMQWIKLIDEFDGDFGVIGNDGTVFYLRTNRRAPKYKLVKVDISDKVPDFIDVIPENADGQLDDVRLVHDDQFLVTYKHNVIDEIYLYSKDGRQLIRLAPDFVGAATLSGHRIQKQVFFTLTGFNTPGTVAMYDFEKPEAERWSVYRATKVGGLRPEDFEARQVWYESKDGTRVPMFIVRHKSTPFDGTAPAIQYGYGGFSISINPFFSPTILSFLQKYGAILAVPNIRGGAEFGEEWHLAGTREKKACIVNCFDDFIAATQYLVKHKYAAPGMVAINGGSNGGLLVAACVNRAPEGTFGAAVAEVGVLDLLKFADYTIGRAWTGDYGDPKDPHDFDFIYPISPLHNVPTDRALPPTMLLTADHDDRVVPMHSFKYAATLQYMHATNPHPLLIRVDKKSGHGAGKSTEKRIQEAADKWGFVAQSMGLTWKD
ncbi:hypothetical protein FISHEDRAFT_69740 [Fistulina hepatica ATCC 64428]|uniref:Prolyl endopeptidase n=1 Tax=Fistulina hepatica ATCC 64428 TaxID=1128425 RepID=A0A0D7ALE9_9AGAR|nr:hypothetical protein FISHEDRAFT_69740 [Fistulina hepatica ATCC 64428]